MLRGTDVMVSKTGLLGVPADAERVVRIEPGFHGYTAGVGRHVPVKWPDASGGPREPER